jgi:hypothetical protein
MPLRQKLLSLVVGSSMLLPALPAFAGDCYADPVYAYTGSGSISSAVFLRDRACMTGSSVLSTVPSGASIQVLGFTDGWYAIGYNGGRGWVGQQFVKTGDASQTGETYDYDGFTAKYPSKAPGAAPTEPKPSTPATTSDASMLSRVSGYILLQTQSHGEAWYVHPVFGKRYYLKDGPTAYQMMRSFGLGVSEKDYASMEGGNTALKAKLRGRIVLRAQAKGEAYYIHPKTLVMHYLADGDEAYRVMRLYSLGITNADLGKLAESTIPLK